MLCQPFPMPRQQRDFARHHTQFRTAGTARRGDRGVFCCDGRVDHVGQPRQHIVDGAAKIEIDRAAGHAIEDKNRCLLTPVERLLRRARDLANAAGRDAAVTLEGDARDVGRRIHDKLLSLLPAYITRVNYGCQ